MNSQTQPCAIAESRKIFRMLRFFSLSSLVCIVLAAVLLTSLYRQVAVRDLIRTDEHDNQLLIKRYLDAVHAPLLAYLEGAEQGLKAPADVVSAVAGLMANDGVVRASVYDAAGILLYSTDPGRIGTSYAGRPEFQAGMKGWVTSVLNYRDNFYPFEREPESDDRIRTSIPIRPGADQAVLGVFEIDRDIRPMANRIEQREYLVFGGSMAILALLYLSLLAIVRHAERVITQQQDTIRERNHALGLLSAQLIAAQEDEKKRLAFELHEGVAQTLSGIKYQMEAVCQPNGTPCPNNSRANDAIVPTLQKTIQEVRTLAMELRPASLDDLGLLPTVEWYCREFRSIYPDIDLRFTSHIEESDIPKPLRVVVFRLIQQMLQHIVRQPCASLVQMQLRKSGDQIRLVLTDNCPATGGEPSRQRAQHLITLRERIKLAGGELEVLVPDETIGSTLRVSWMT